jgi:hypothetical protein
MFDEYKSGADNFPCSKCGEWHNSLYCDYQYEGKYITDYSIEYLPIGYYRCSKCKTLVPIESSLGHECITSQSQIIYNTDFLANRQLLEQILKELQEIKNILRGMVK